MAYVKINWQDSPLTTTPVNAANLGHMETQYEEAVAEAGTLADAAEAAANAYTDTNAVPKSLATGAGVIPVATGAGAFAALGAGGDGQALMADSSQVQGVKWADVYSGPPVLTPSSSADAVGEVGDIASDDDYVYVKTSTGWKRAALAAW